MSNASIRGILVRVRTALAELVAELVTLTPQDQEVPDKLAADQVIQFVITGDRPTIHYSPQHAADGGTNVTVGGGSAPGPVTVSGAHGSAIGSQSASGANSSVVGSQRPCRPTATPSSPDGTPTYRCQGPARERGLVGAAAEAGCGRQPSPPSSAPSPLSSAPSSPVRVDRLDTVSQQGHGPACSPRRHHCVGKHPVAPGALART